MPSASKRKGNAGEREIVELAQEHGLISERAWGSNGKALGEHEEVDVLASGLKIQAKRRKAIAKYLLPSEHVDLLAFRADRGEWHAVIKLDTLFKWIADADGW